MTTTLADALRDSARPVFLFGVVPPKEGTSVEKAMESCAKFAARSAVLASDGFLVYDIQNEAGRTSLERPFPFKQCMNSAQYASFFPAVSGKQCVVYKSVVEDDVKQFDEWMDVACNKYHHSAYNLVGAPSSEVQYKGLKLHAAGLRLQKRKNSSFGCVCIPDRQTSNGDEILNMLKKAEFGADWFTTQGIFSAAPVSKLLNEYGDLCRERGLVPKKVVLTFAPCGRPKTMAFMKWLGMRVPEEKERRIFEAEVPVQESLVLLGEILTNILLQTSNSGVPIGLSVESLSIFKDEIDAARDLFQQQQVSSILLFHSILFNFVPFYSFTFDYFPLYSISLY